MEIKEHYLQQQSNINLSLVIENNPYHDISSALSPPQLNLSQVLPQPPPPPPQQQQSAPKEPSQNSTKMIPTQTNEMYHDQLLTLLKVHNNNSMNNIYYRTVPKIDKSVLTTMDLYTDPHIVICLNF